MRVGLMSDLQVIKLEGRHMPRLAVGWQDLNALRLHLHAIAQMTTDRDRQDNLIALMDTELQRWVQMIELPTKEQTDEAKQKELS